MVSSKAKTVSIVFRAELTAVDEPWHHDLTGDDAGQIGAAFLDHSRR